MNIILMVSSAVHIIFPLQFAIDCSDLPQKTRYAFTIKLETTAAEKIEIPVMVGIAADRDDVLDVLYIFLKQNGWNVRKSGLTLIVQGKGKNPIKCVTFDQDDKVKPTVLLQPKASKH
jgi:hypothetical protein